MADMAKQRNRTMKKTLVITLLAICAALRAGNLPQNTPCVSYSLPYTCAAAHIEYQRVEQQPGIFYQYAERYLGKVDVITEAKTSYRLLGVTLKTRVKADPGKTFVFDLTKQVPALQIDKKGILVAIGNIEVPAPQPRHDIAKADCASDCAAELLPPLTEEHLRAGSIAKMAESTAKLIYRLREDRINIIAGETETADGEAMKTMLKKLEQTERQLTELFTGTCKQSTLSSDIECPVDVNRKSQVLFRFSRYSGVADAADLSGEPVMIDVETTKTEFATEAKAPKAPESAIYYNMPGKASVRIYNDDKVFVERDLDVAQLGVAVPMPANIIKNGCCILLNPQTGAIQSIK